MIEWTLVAMMAGPVIGAVAGAWAMRTAERRPKLVSYYGHVSSFRVEGDDDREGFLVHTHNVVVRNGGRKSAKNVRLGHNYLPGNVNVVPAVDYEVLDVPGGGKEMVFPTLVPGEQVTVSYLYYPPVTYAQINSYVMSDEGMARVITVLLQPQYPRWVNWVVAALMGIGVLALLYVLIVVLRLAIAALGLGGT